MISDRIKELRDKRGLSQREFADAVGVTNGAVGMWESGKRTPNRKTAKKLADFFDVTVSYIMDEPEKENAEAKASGWKPSLTARDHKDIDSYLDGVEAELSSAEGMLFDGEPATKEDVESIINAMRVGVEMAKLKNKEKYTPKKYRK